MKLNQVAVQLYTLRDYLKTPPEIINTLKKVKEIGFNVVQVSGLGPIEMDSLRKILDDEGLLCCATHEPPSDIINQPEIIVERLNKLNCKNTSYPYPADINFNTIDDIKSLAEKLNRSGNILHQSGICLTYHNHHLEFKRVNGKPVLEWIYQYTDPKYLQAEIDTYWVQYGGGNPAEWCKKLNHRIPLLHMKDYRITQDNKIDFAEVGYGNLNWKEIVSAAEQSGCKWFIVEQDVCPGNPFDSIQLSYEYIRENLCT